MRWLRSTTIMPIAVCAKRSNIDCAASFSTPSALCGNPWSAAIAGTVARPCSRPGHWKTRDGRRNYRITVRVTGLVTMVDPTPLHGTSMHDGVATRLRAMVFDRELADQPHAAARGAEGAGRRRAGRVGAAARLPRDRDDRRRCRDAAAGDGV